MSAKIRRPPVQPTFSKFVRSVPNSWRTAGSARVRDAGSVFKCACADVSRDAIGPRGISSAAATLADGERPSRGEAYRACRYSLAVSEENPRGPIQSESIDQLAG
mgnify:CR=1 FL=1